jgi:hydrogenase/urease accessory protein HupE
MSSRAKAADLSRSETPSMNGKTIGVAALIALVLMEPAFAHHMTGGRTPATFGEGMLSGLGHPVIGLDQFAAVAAVGYLAAAHRAEAALAAGFVLALSRHRFMPISPVSPSSKARSRSPP